jgi:hypothetical protein
MLGRSHRMGKPARACTGAGAAATAILVLAVTGCSGGGQPGSTVPTGHPSQSGQPVTALPSATCGHASTHDLNASTQILDADQGALTCFQAAARQCVAASLAVTEMGIDAGTNHVFAIEPGGKDCQVSDVSQFYTANNHGGSQGTIATTRCRLADVSATGVTLGCGGQNVLIPTTVTGPAARGD